MGLNIVYIINNCIRGQEWLRWSACYEFGCTTDEVKRFGAK